MRDGTGKGGESSTISVVALTGFMGSGKSSVARAIAATLGWAFVDLDATIEAREGRSIREMFANGGEGAFREIESATLVSVLDAVAQPTVIALGGGAFVQPNMPELLKARGVTTVFLELPVEEMLDQCGIHNPAKANVRPLARDEKAFRELYEARLPLYRMADFTLTDHGTTAAARAESLIRKLQLRHA